MDLITLAAAQAIAKIALDKFVEGGAGELGKKLTEPVAQKVMQLGTAVWNRIRDNPPAAQALEKAAQEDPQAIQQLKNYLHALWQDDQSEFTQEVRQRAQEIHFELTQIADHSVQTQNNYGGTNFQNKVSGGKVYQAETITIHESGSD